MHIFCTSVLNRNATLLPMLLTPIYFLSRIGVGDGGVFARRVWYLPSILGVDGDSGRRRVAHSSSRSNGGRSQTGFCRIIDPADDCHFLAGGAK